MGYQELNSTLYEELRAKGYKYFILGDSLDNEAVGFDPGCAFGHFEVIPVIEEPGNDVLCYYDIGSPEAVDMVNGIDLVFFWMQERRAA